MEATAAKSKDPLEQQRAFTQALSNFLSLTDPAYVYNPPYLVNQYNTFLVFAQKAMHKYQRLCDATDLLRQSAAFKNISRINSCRLTLSINNLWLATLISPSSKVVPDKHTLMEHFEKDDWNGKDSFDIFTLTLSTPNAKHTHALCSRNPISISMSSDGMTTSDDAQEIFNSLVDCLDKILSKRQNKGEKSDEQ